MSTIGVFSTTGTTILLFCFFTSGELLNINYDVYLIGNFTFYLHM